MSGQKKHIRGFDVYYEKYGTGRQALLLVPGGTGSIHTDLRPLIAGLSKTKYTIIAVDPIGYGKSRPPDRDYKKGVGLYKTDAEVCVELMRQLGYSSFDWIGWSDGGRVGLVAAITFQSRIDRLVVWGALSSVTSRQQLALEAARDLKYWDAERRQAFVEEYGDLETATKVWGRHVDYYNTLNDICSNDVCKIRCPVLILHGDRDPVEKSLVQRMASQISDSQFHSFPNIGHAVHVENSNEFVKIVESFLDQDL